MVQHGCNDIRSRELCMGHRGKALIRCPHTVYDGRINDNLFNVLWSKAMSLCQITDNLHRSLHPHIGGPVFQQSFHDKIALTQIAGQPGLIRLICSIHRIGRAALGCIAANNGGIATGAIQRIPLVMDALFRSLGNQESIAGTITMFIVIKVRHGRGMIGSG